MKILTRLQNELFGLMEFINLIFYYMLILLSISVILAPLAWITSIIFVGFFTSLAMENRKSGTMAIGGIIIYLLSWPVKWEYGIWCCTAVWALANVIWFAAVYEIVIPKLTKFLNQPVCWSKAKA